MEVLGCLLEQTLGSDVSEKLVHPLESQIARLAGLGRDRMWRSTEQRMATVEAEERLSTKLGA